MIVLYELCAEEHNIIIDTVISQQQHRIFIDKTLQLTDEEQGISLREYFPDSYYDGT